jgi:hypothetical protein
MRNEDAENAGMETAEKEEHEISFEEIEFVNFCEANEIDHDELSMDDDDRKGFAEIKNRFIKAVKQKRLVIDGTKLEYTISKFSAASAGEKLIISRPTGKDFFAMDGFRETQKMQQFNGFVASLAGKEKSYIARLDIKDRQFLQDIATLFITA